MEPSGLRRKDTTKGPPLRVLSLDGGGVRGYSMLILLQELMYKTYSELEGRAPTRDAIPKPCDHFDLIAGTGTGGLIAIMLGRLRLDLETCKDVYVRMTRRVFETDKTIAGIPYRSTLFKASKLEEAIKECVRDHTGGASGEEGNDGSSILGAGGGGGGGGAAGSTADVASTKNTVMSPSPSVSSATGPPMVGRSATLVKKRLSVASSVNSGYNPGSPKMSTFSTLQWGDPNAYLYDAREDRTKTAVTAVYKGASKNDGSVLLRSYDSRKEPAPEFLCTIWEAGRATCATGLAFKPIQIGQSVFIDQGVGKYNPSPQILDEAVINEWPGRELGVFVSIGTGRRPPGTGARQHEWWEGFAASAPGLGDFAEARRRLISKIEGCEETHQYMLSEHLAKRRVNRDNYYRLNVEVGVGEFGMNEWSRLADISTSTRRYLARAEVKRLNEDAAAKIARIERSKRRYAASFVQPPPSVAAAPATMTIDGSGNFFRNDADGGGGGGGDQMMTPTQDVPPPMDPLAVELPGDDGRTFENQRVQQHGPRYPLASSPEDKFAVVHGGGGGGGGGGDELSIAPTPTTPRRSHESYRSNHSYQQQQQSSYPPQSSLHSAAPQAPPIPPKTPIQNFVSIHQPPPPPVPSSASAIVSPISPEPQDQQQQQQLRNHHHHPPTYQHQQQQQQQQQPAAYSYPPLYTPSQGQGAGLGSGGNASLRPRPHPGQQQLQQQQQQQPARLVNGHVRLPYPDDDGPPPIANLAGKPIVSHAPR